MEKQTIRFPIRVKLIIALFLCIILPVLLIGYFAFAKVDASLSSLEQDSAVRTAQSLQSTMQTQSENLLQQDISFAKWDAFNQALQKHDVKWIVANVDAATSVFNDLNFLDVFDSQNQLVSQVGNLADFSNGLTNSAILNKLNNQNYISGVIQTQNGLALIAVAKVTNLNGQGTSYGTLVVGQYVTASVLQAWKSIYNADIAVLSNNGHFVATSTTLTQPTLQGMMSLAMSNQLNDFAKVTFNGTTMNQESIPLKDLSGSPVGVETISLPATASTSVMQSFVNYSIIALIVLLVMMIVFFVFLGQVIIAPVKHLALALQDVAKGSLTFEAKERYRRHRDEIGLLARSYEMMRINLRNLLEYVNSNVTQAVNTIYGTSQELTNGFRASEDASERMMASLDKMTRGAEAQMEATSQSALAGEEISKGIMHIADASVVMLEVAKRTSDLAAKGKTDVVNLESNMDRITTNAQQMSVTIKQLGERSKMINQIVQGISGIASQTNMLALNASIEAARAGEHGKGFAVVAEEVRKLAEQSDHFAMQIIQHLQEMLAESEQSEASMDQMLTLVNQGHVTVKNSTALFEQILSTSTEVTQQNISISAATEQMAASSEEVSASLEQMASISKDTNARSKDSVGAAKEQAKTMQQVGSFIEELVTISEQLQDAIKKIKL